MFMNKWGKLFSIFSTMVLFCCSYTLSICSPCHKVSNSPSCAFVTSFSSETEIKSLSGISPGHSYWTSGLIKRIHLMSKTSSIQIEPYTLHPKVCRKFTTSKLLDLNFFPLNTSPFQAILSQKSANCHLTNGWWNAWFYHYFFYTKASQFFLQELGLS